VKVVSIKTAVIPGKTKRTSKSVKKLLLIKSTSATCPRAED